MNSRNMILSGALIALVMLVTTNVFFSSFAAAVPVGTGINLTAGLQALVVKKIAYICDSGASAPASQSPPEIGGCVDDNFGSSALGSVNATDVRFNQYLFTGERLDELVVARDLSGAQFLASTASLYVDSASKVICTDVTSGVGGYAGHWTYSFNGDQVGTLLNVMPAAFGVNDPTGFDPSRDKLYDCVLTVDNSMIGAPSSVYVNVMDTLGNSVSTVVQKWYFNPAISISVSFDSGTSIHFPAAQAGSTVYSDNTMIIRNTALGGVDLVTYLTGNDLTSPMPALCPGSNTLDINNMAYRCLVGSIQSEQWTKLPHLKENNGCTSGATPASAVPAFCDVQDAWTTSNLIMPDAAFNTVVGATSIIASGHQAQCWFQLTVPFPCLGTFSAANAVDILVRAL